MTEIKNDKYDNRILSDFDEAFGTLSLVNATDMDVYLKVIMSVDEKVAQNIRGELNHVVTKYIDNDPELKEKLKKNYYFNYNADYIIDHYHKLKKQQMEHGERIIGYVVKKIMELSNETNDGLCVFDIIKHYVKGVATIKSKHLSSTDADTFLNKCCLDLKYSKHIATIHNALTKMFKTLEMIFDSDSPMISHIFVDPVENNYSRHALNGFTITFGSEIELGKYYNGDIVIDTSIINFSDNEIVELVEYFRECNLCEDECSCGYRGVPYFSYEDTLKYAHDLQLAMNK